MKKQFFLFLAIFLVLTIGMHFSVWVNHPLEHFLSLPQADAYGIGIFHPLIFSFIVYLFVAFILWIIDLIRKLFPMLKDRR